MFLLFVWIHILQQGIWDMETRKLSRSPMRFFISHSNRFFRHVVFPSTQELKRLELGESLDGLTGTGQDTQNVEADLLEQSALRWIRLCGVVDDAAYEVVSPDSGVLESWRTTAAAAPHQWRNRGPRTVLDRGRHWPTVTQSPSSTRKAGET